MSAIFKNSQVQEISYLLDKIEYIPYFNPGDAVCLKTHPSICIGTVCHDITCPTLGEVLVYVNDEFIKNFYPNGCVNTLRFDANDLMIYKQIKVEKELMETQKMQLVVPEGFEFDKASLEIKDGKLVINAVKTKAPYSKSWDEFCKYNYITEDEVYLTANGIIQGYPHSQKFRLRDATQSRTNIPRKFAKAILALEQLLTIRELEYTKGWEPTANPQEYFWAIWAGTDCTINTGERCGAVYPLSFPSKELCMEFYNNWQNLIMTAGLLL